MEKEKLRLIDLLEMRKERTKVFAKEIHENIAETATEFLKRWTKPCGGCGEIDYEVGGTRFEEDGTVIAYILCAHCGGGYSMFPVSLQAIEDRRKKGQTDESSRDS